MSTIQRTIKSLKFFGGLTDDRVAGLADCATLVDFEPNELLIRAGGRPDRFYIVVSGRVAVELDEEDRPRVQGLGPDDVLGSSFVTPNEPWLFNIRALEPTTAVMMDGPMVLRACDADCGLGYEILKRFVPVLALRLRATRQELIRERLRFSPNRGGGF